MSAKKTAKPKTVKTTRKPRAKKNPAPEQKNFDYANVWERIGSGYTGLSHTYDAFQTERNPTPEQLIAAFTDVVYSCATLRASSLAEIDFMLCAETTTGQTAPVNAPKMWKRPKHRSKAVELHELHDHPVLDLLRNPNPSLTYADLITATSLYLDILGRAFWLITPNTLGQPGRIDVLPAHLVKTERDDAGNVVGYQLGKKANHDDEPTYKPDQILAFRRQEYFDPEQEGVSPVKAVWQKLQLSYKELSSWEVMVSQMAQPSVSFSPKDANAPLAPEAVERFVKEYQSRLNRGGQGGPLFLNDAIDMNVLTFPPKDQAGLALQDGLKTAICNVFTTPRTLLDMQDANFASAKTAERSFQLYGLKPSISYIFERITVGIIWKFDDRLFLEHAEFIERDELLYEQQKVNAVMAYQAQLTTKNEARGVLGFPPTPDGNAFYVPPAPSPPAGLSLSLAGPEGVTAAPPVEAKAVPDDPYDKYSIKPVVEILQKWFNKQKEYVLSRATEKAYRSKAWFDLSQFTEQMAHDLYPAMSIFYDGAAKAFATKYGLTDDVWSVVTPKLSEAVQRATMRFAESTNRTTSLALEDARQRLRDELEDGVTAGDNYSALSARVQSIFENCSDERAYLIASSERSRAIGSAELVTAKESGVVKKKVWLADSRACDRCKSLNGQERDLDEPFFVDPKGGPYSVCQSSPAHPGCRCVQTFKLNDE